MNPIPPSPLVDAAALRAALTLHLHEAPDPSAARRHIQKLGREEARALLDELTA